MGANRVKGWLFGEYVRMIRQRKDVDWSGVLGDDDLGIVRQRIANADWYPMDVFERLGNAILSQLPGDKLRAVRLWGGMSVDDLLQFHPNLVVRTDPVESLMRFRVLRSTFFDFEAIQIPMLVHDAAHIVIAYGMGAIAEEAAAHQTMGFFERVVALSGGRDVRAAFVERSWAGDTRTLLELGWTSPKT